MSGFARVCLCVYLAVQFFHSNKVQGLERVSSRGNEIKADVDPGVMIVKQRTFDLQLFLEIVLKLSVDVVHDGLVTVEKVPEGNRIYKTCQRKIFFFSFLHL